MSEEDGRGEEAPAPAPVLGWWATWRARYEKLVEEFGWSAIGTYLVLFFGTWFGFWIAIKTGFEPSDAASGAGTVGGAWVATKVTQPIRIGLTVVLTPFVVRLRHAIGR